MRRILTSLILAAGAAQAEPVLLDAEAHAQWQAVGRVNQAGYNRARLCTGTLIAPDLVLTAAHCVRDAVSRITFVAGWYRGQHAAAARVADVVTDPRGIEGAPLNANELQYDTAVLRLEPPIENIAPLSLSEGQGPFAIVGYSREVPHALTGQFDCEATERLKQLIFTDCPVIEGTSGAPLLTQGEEGWQVSGVVVARSPRETRESVAVMFDASVFGDVFN